MTRREQIERIVMDMRGRYLGLNALGWKEDWSPMIDKIMAALEPDEAGLSRVLAQYPIYLLNPKAFAADLMAWARGEPEKSHWCEHIQRCNCGQPYGDLVFTSDKGLFHHVPDYWKLCPICGARRPG